MEHPADFRAPSCSTSIYESSEEILSHLKRYQPAVVKGVDPSLHYLPPHVPKVKWSALGDLISAREKGSSGNVPGDRWISLRLDGSNFSNTVRAMRRKGILEETGYSQTFASCMQSSLKALMEHFHCHLGYTQSDEMIVYIPPTNVVRGEQQVHVRGGRVTKLTTLAASYVTAHFIMQLSKHCLRRGVDLDDLSHLLPHFDCRLGHYESWEEARALLLWRAFDCSVNGVSDAVYQTKGSAKQIQERGKLEKVAWLNEQGLLPLPTHQAYGTVYVRVKRVVDGYNPKLGTQTKSLRGVIEQVEGPVLELARTDSLIPVDDALSA